MLLPGRKVRVKVARERRGRGVEGKEVKGKEEGKKGDEESQWLIRETP